MTDPIKKIIIVGGGAAGWLSAALLAKQFESKTSSISITLIESSDIPTVGVGEGTWPTMRNTLRKIGLDENVFLRECNASFKQGNQFIGWCNGQEDDKFYHPFSAPQAHGKFDLSPYWLQASKQNFASSVCFQPLLCDLNLAPKSMTDKQFQGQANYGYHLDAGKFGQLIKEHTVDNLGVTHVIGTVEQVKLDEHGNIKQIELKDSKNISGDFFIDCTGFSSLLLGQALNVPFIQKSDVLLADRALAVQVPYDDEESPVASHTKSVAQDSGWVWDVGLSNRRGVGYVYASEYTTTAQAKQTLADYIGVESDQLNVKEIEFTAGHREKFWHKNCVAIGLSAGFLEPLEAAALMLIEISAEQIALQLPGCKSLLPIVAERFNHDMVMRWQKIIEFLKLHYVLSKREEPFWKAMRAESSVPTHLSQQLKLWKYQPPNVYDFSSAVETFPAASYLYVLYGMDFQTDLSQREHLVSEQQLADKLFYLNKQATVQVSQRLPDHRALLTKIKYHDFQKV
jgi:tryptophan halogenase